MKINTKDFIGKRADFILRKKLIGAKLSFIFSLFRKKKVLVNDNVIKNNYRIKSGDIINLDISSDKFKFLSKKGKHFSVLFEDSNYFIVEKGPGLSVHGDNESNLSLLGEIKKFVKKTYYLVNRLDKETSGIVILAKDKLAQKKLCALVEKREVEKRYYGLVKGVFKKTGKIISKLEVIKKNHSKFVKISSKGKQAITEYRLVKKMKDFSLLDLSLITGRTHQIRVQFKVYGDNKYGVSGDRMFLHAYLVKFKHPFTGKIVKVKSKLPKDLEKIKL